MSSPIPLRSISAELLSIAALSSAVGIAASAAVPKGFKLDQKLLLRVFDCAAASAIGLNLS